MDVFLPLAIEGFGCRDYKANNFFHWYANMAWPTKGTKDPPLLVFLFIKFGKVSWNRNEYDKEWISKENKVLKAFKDLIWVCETKNQQEKMV